MGCIMIIVMLIIYNMVMWMIVIWGISEVKDMWCD